VSYKILSVLNVVVSYISYSQLSGFFGQLYLCCFRKITLYYLTIYSICENVNSNLEIQLYE